MNTKKNGLRFWHGFGYGKYYSKDNRTTIYVAAYGWSEAARLVSRACFKSLTAIKAHEIKANYIEAWGTPMEGITPTAPCLFIQEDNFTPRQII